MQVKKALKTYIKFFFLFLGILILIGGGITCGYVYSIVSNTEELDISNFKMDFTSFVYYTDPETGELVEMDRLYDNENRIWVSYDQIPQYMKDAVVAIEDERFYSHKGYDTKRIIGAVFNTLKKGDYGYGASTITQQLVKNLTGDDDVNIERKIQEIYRAAKLEKKHSKEDILELYLNTIYLSQQCNGVQAAANVYFDKDVSELTLAECASLAGITQYPSLYDPIVNPQKNKEKQELVLSKMLELGKISQAEYDAAIHEKLVFAHKDAEDTVILSNSYFVDTVIDEVISDLQTEYGYTRQVALKMLYSGGLQIHTTVDINVQKTLETIYADNNNFPKETGDVEPESAAVVIDPETGNIVGIVGGRGKKSASRTLNRATDTLRQPGSTIKPIAVYAPAIEYGHITPNTTIVDGPISINNWSPTNSGKGYSGPVSIRTAVAKSLNTVAVKVLQKITLNTSFEFLTKNLGITSLVENELRNGEVYSDKQFPSLALGGLTDGVSVVEMCAAYASFANEGKYNSPTTYTQVLNHNGKVILERKPEQTQKIAMSETTAYQMTQLLQGVIQSGTATNAKLNNMPAAGKTGTTDRDKDRWFIGYTPYYVTAVWFGFDQPKSLGYNTNPAIPLWRSIMNEIHQDKEYKTFKMPSDSKGSQTIKICSVSGKRATALCSLDIRGNMVKYVSSDNANIPSGSCTAHKSYRICTKSNMLANTGCPSTNTVSALGVSSEPKDGHISSDTCNQHAPQRVPPPSASPAPPEKPPETPIETPSVPPTIPNVPQSPSEPVRPDRVR